MKYNQKNKPNRDGSQMSRVNKPTLNNSSKKLKQATIQTSIKSKTLLCSTARDSSNNIIETRVVKCSDCLMAYNKFDPLEVHRHQEFHDLQMKGLKWSISNYMKQSKFVYNPAEHDGLKNRTTPDILTMFASNKKLQTPTPSSSQLVFKSSTASDEYIVEIQQNNVQEVKLAEKLLDLVNEELTAPKDENGFWIHGDGKCFVFLKNGRAVGVITLENLQTASYKMKWMVLSTKQIVEHVNPVFCVGVSRIWVSKQYRRHGFAMKLLQTACKHSFAGKELKPSQIAWSQPSDSGSKTAKKFNSVLHKNSGELLIPVYL